MPAYRLRRFALPIPFLVTASLLTVSVPARADVTVQQVVNIDALAVKMDTTTTERISGDKRRSDSETHCHGFLALFCHDVQSGGIVRLDKQLEWQLEPKKKAYLETLFPTPEQRAQAREQMKAMLDKVKECQQQQRASNPQGGPDTSSCELSKPTLNVRESDEHLTLVGHDTRKSSIVLSQTCTDKQSGDVCQIDYTFESWLTQDDVPGSSERKSFQQKYLAALGLDPSDPQLQGAMRQLLAQYGDQLKELSTHASRLKGYALRTRFSMSFGGEHCGKAKQQAAQSDDGSSSHDLGFKGITSNAVGHALSSLFGKHGANATASSAAGQSGANATEAAADDAGKPTGDSGKIASAQTATPPNTAQVISFTIETKSIDTSAIAAEQFEIPVGWKLQPAKPAKEREQFSCPATGSS
jgi:hypothetical protein